MVHINFNQTILPACQQSKNPCIISLDSSGLKAPIQLLGRGRSYLAQLLNLGCLGQAMALKGNFIAYLTNFIFLVVRLLPGNMVMVAIDICGKSPITGEWQWNYMKTCISFYFFVSFFIWTPQHQLEGSYEIWLVHPSICPSLLPSVGMFAWN